MSSLRWTWLLYAVLGFERIMLVLLASADAGERVNKSWIAIDIYQASPKANQQVLSSIYILLQSISDILRINLPFTHSHSNKTNSCQNSSAKECPRGLVHQSASPIPLSLNVEWLSSSGLRFC